MTNLGKSVKNANRTNKNDELMDKMKHEISKTKRLENLTEIFRKQRSAAKEIKTWTAKNLFYFDFDFSNVRVGRARKTTYLIGLAKIKSVTRKEIFSEEFLIFYR